MDEVFVYADVSLHQMALGRNEIRTTFASRLMKSPLHFGGLDTKAQFLTIFVSRLPENLRGGLPENLRDVVPQKLPDAPNIAYDKLTLHDEVLHTMTTLTVTATTSRTSRTPCASTLKLTSPVLTISPPTTSKQAEMYSELLFL